MEEVAAAVRLACALIDGAKSVVDLEDAVDNCEHVLFDRNVLLLLRHYFLFIISFYVAFPI